MLALLAYGGAERAANSFCCAPQAHMGGMSAGVERERGHIERALQRVPDAYMAHFGDYKELMSMSHNYRNYRERLA